MEEMHYFKKWLIEHPDIQEPHFDGWVAYEELSELDKDDMDKIDRAEDNYFDKQKR